MLGKSHRIVTESLLTGGCIIAHEPLPIILLLDTGAYFGSTLPDVDLRLQKYIRHFYHRTWTHTIWAVAIVSLLAWLLPAGVREATVTLAGTRIPVVRLFYWGVDIGYVLHIVEDSFSRMGILWTYPLRKYSVYYRHPYIRGRRKRFWMYRTGGKEEMWIRRVCVILLTVEWVVILCW